MAIHRRFSLLLFPTLFTEKLMLRVAIDRRDILRQMADKMEMRRYVENKLGKRYLPRLYCVTNDPRSIAFDTLPSKFVVKANHGSGFVRVVADKKIVDVQSLVSECQGWLNIDYGQCYREWGYIKLKRCLMVEEFAESSYKDKQARSAENLFARQFRKRLTHARKALSPRLSDRRLPSIHLPGRSKARRKK